MLAVHAFTYGGVGMVTIGMMARVSLGHTGRDVFNLSKLLGPTFLMVLIGSIIRVGLPLLIPQDYNTLILISQLLWVLAFIMFIAYYFPVWVEQSRTKN